MTDTEPAPIDVVTPASRLIGRRWIGVDPQTGVARAAFLAREEFANRHGIVHGGFLAAMLDSGAGFALLGTLPPDRTMVTARLDVEFLKPAPLGPFETHARVVSRDARGAIVTADLIAPDGVVVARAQASMRFIRRAKTDDRGEP